MQVHRELFIRGEPDRLDAIGEDIRRSLADGWTRDADAEDHMRSIGHQRKVFCFSSPKRPRRPAATVFLLNRDSHTLYVANVVPHDTHELSRDEYNAIVEEFFRQYAEPAATRNGACAELTEPKADLERWLTPEAAEKLRVFCAVANKRTGSSHPVDRERWYDFIVAAQEGETEFSASTLARWLVEEGGWDDEMAEKLAIEYEFARGLLSFSGGERVGA
jgi:hypothetical protein